MVKSFFFKVTLIMSLLLVTTSTTFAQGQTQTSYEKKVLEIKKKYVKKILIQSGKWTSQSEGELSYGGENYINLALGLGIFTAPNLAKSLQTELKAAEKFKTAVDFKREKEKKAATEQSNKEREKRELQTAYERSDRGFIQKNIKYDFLLWNQKGEFEKQADFEERLQNQSQSRFIEICIEKIKEKIRSFDNYDSRLEKNLLKYDSENEVFPISFKFNGNEWQNKLKISISNAEDFKTKWDYLYWQKNEYNWCFVENSLLPTTITLREKNSTIYNFDLQLQNQQEISVAFNDLEIKNQYLGNFVFKYSTAKEMDIQIAKQKQIRDSLEFISYNNKLAQLERNYNQQLLQNPYNINRVIITKSYQVDKDYLGNKERLERDFESKSDYIRNTFNGLDDFEGILKIKNPIEFCKIFYSLNSDKKVAADKQFLECGCNYTSRVNFDIQFINNNLSNCNCRNTEFEKNGILFTDKAEFEIYFEKGYNILQKEVEARRLKKDEETAINEIISNASKIESLDFKDVKLNLSTNDLSTYYFRKIYKYKNMPYYAKVVDVLFENNKGLTKEWTKKGEVFSNKVEFYEAFTSGEYKIILIEKKK